MTSKERQDLLGTLQARFDAHMQRHAGVSWAQVLARIESRPEVLRSLQAMEASGGEPDVICAGHVGLVGEVGGAGDGFVFCDCSPESPTGRRSTCFDGQARLSRKENQPTSSAMEMAADMGVRLLNEAQYRALQQLGEFDTKTSSWVDTPPPVRALGGALFCDRRYGQVFTYHNGVQSYYASRGFRGWLQV
jgi:hypothetical protein